MERITAKNDYYSIMKGYTGAIVGIDEFSNGKMNYHLKINNVPDMLFMVGQITEIEFKEIFDIISD